MGGGGGGGGGRQQRRWWAKRGHQRLHTHKPPPPLLATSLTLPARLPLPARPPAPACLPACLQVFSYSHEFDRVLGVWQAMEAARFAPTARLWGSLLLACSAAGQLEQAAIYWWEMKQLHSQGAGGVLTTDNVCAMMTACNDAGQVGAGCWVLGARAGGVGCVRGGAGQLSACRQHGGSMEAAWRQQQHAPGSCHAAAAHNQRR